MKEKREGGEETAAIDFPLSGRSGGDVIGGMYIINKSWHWDSGMG